MQTGCWNLTDVNSTREGKWREMGKVGERDYLHLAFDRLAVGINTIGSHRDQ